MKNAIGFLSVIAFVAVIGLLMAACGDVNNGGDNPPVPQTVEYGGIGADGTIYSLKITENTARYAAQAGDSYVLVIIKIDGTKQTSSGTVTTAGAALILTPTGASATFTVTISGTGITKITGTITFTDGTPPEEEVSIATTPIQTTPEILPDAERWWSWSDEISNATITHSVDNDGVCTITVKGAPESDAWKAMAGYDYTTVAGKIYDYTFEAWTQSGNRDLNFQYYNGWQVDDVYIWKNISITNERKTYTVFGEILPNNATVLDFQCANKVGTFYVKILEIKEYPWESLPVADRWGKWIDEPGSGPTLDYSVDAEGVCTIDVGGTAAADNYKASAHYSYPAKKGKKYTYTFEAWTESGDRTVFIIFYEGYEFKNDVVNMTTTRQTFTLNTVLPKDGIQKIHFQCGSQTGKFYVKILDIKETP